jgi:prolyl oligopeptidase
MKQISLLSAIFASLFFSCTMEQPTSSSALIYPVTAKTDVADDYFGVRIPDPYRWLEDDTAKQTEEWVSQQNAVTFGYLEQIPYRESIRKRYEALFNYPKLSSPFKAGEYFFFYKNDGLQNQSVIYFQKGIDGKPEVFIDPNALSAEGTVSIQLIGFSRDYKYVAYSRNEAGSDWQQIKVMEVATKKELEDELKWVKFSGAAWKGNGFYYSRYPEPKEGGELSSSNQFHWIYYHELGTPQSKDQLIFSDKDHPYHYHSASITEDERYLLLYTAEGTDGFECHYDDLNENGINFVPLFTGFKNKSSVIDHVNGSFLVQTDIGAPNYRMVAVDLKNPAKKHWKDLLPEKENLLQGVSTAGGYLFANYLENATTKILRYDYDGTNEMAIELPAPGSAGGFSARKEDSSLYYSFTSFTYPNTIFKLDIQKGTSTLFHKSELQFDPEAYETKQVFYNSKDGTSVSMFIVHKKGLELNGNNPTYLYGYGGFNISLTPSFSASRIILLENGGVFAMPNLRGGGEYGEDWHKGGMLLKKQNVFDDFIAAAEYLIKEKYTNSSKLGIAGGSNGGLLVGACMTQRPDLFQVAFPAVGVLDMLRYHKFTVGHGWVPEYGSSDKQEDFNNLLSYSPLHNVKEDVDYPATMITTADHDDRVVPAHSFKFAATLQEKYSGNRPMLIRIETNAGHGAGKPTSKIIEEQADIWSFLFYNCGIKEIASTGKK